MVEAVCVDPEKVDQVWPYVSRFIKAASHETNLCDFASVEEGCLAGRSLVWIAWNGERIEAAAVTSLEKANGKLACVIVACGGEQHTRWLSLIASIEQYAKDEGCSAVRVIGRKGWARVLKDYQTKHIVIEKAL